QRYAQLADKQQQRQKTLARLNASINNKDQQLKQLAQDRAHLEHLLQEVIEVTAGWQPQDNSQPFAKLRGKLPWPTKGAIVHSFGSSRSAGKMKWNGVMINASQGAEVTAIHRGQVVFADYLRGHGLLMIVDHGDNYMSLYAHNQALYKTTGDRVKAGEVIANVGNSGGLARAGLYFEIRFRGQPTNPAKWCRNNS
ncbi:MAG: peptidoglycan DD-metalloendopeptidase family protein, partial [Exilibacterium sp.]